MTADPKAQIEEALRRALESQAPQHAGAPIALERPKQAGHGDFSSNLALQLAKTLKTSPRQLAAALVSRISGDFLEKAEVAGPGFINFTLRAGAKSGIVRRILEEGARYGRATREASEKVQDEFV